MILKLCTVYLLFCCSLEAHRFEDPKTWSDPEIAHILETSEITKSENMRDALTNEGKKVNYTNNVFLIELQDRIKAVFKPLPAQEQRDAQIEVAAYKASLYLGFPYVPPTVLRKIGEDQGSLQLFIKTPIDLLATSAYATTLQQVSPEEHSALRLFYFVFGQWDSGPENLLAYQDGTNMHLIAIDNSAMSNRQKVRYGDLPFVEIVHSEALDTSDFDQPFPFDQETQIIYDLSREKIEPVFGHRLPTAFYENFKYKGALKYIVYQNSLWRQYYAFDGYFVRSYIENCSLKTLDNLRGLDLECLKKIFSMDSLTLNYFEDILERRDQVLNFFDKRK